MQTEISGNGDMGRSSNAMKQCIDNCRSCHEMCTQMIKKCLSMGGKHAEPAHIALMQGCARICATSAELMLLGTEAHVYTCRACAEICTLCADDCDRLGAEMQDCSDACRRCAETCEEMAASKN